MNMLTGYLSEWGSNELDFSKKDSAGKRVSTHFIITAIVVAKEDIPETERILSAINFRHFNNKGIHPEQITDHDALRKLILEDLQEAPFQIFALIVDKRQVIREGVQYKGSFQKFLQVLLDRELFKAYPDLYMVPGPAGNESFMKGFVSFVQQNHISNLFNESSFGFINDQNVIISQTAGLVCETLARCYDETVISDQRQQFLELLHPKLVAIKFWPDELDSNVVRSETRDVLFDPKLAALSISLANAFLQKKANPTAPHILDQVTTLSYLLFHFRHINAVRYISSFEIMQHIRVRRGRAVSLHYFQTKVIAPLRDAGVLIASSSKGYKLPAGEPDLYDFINHSNAIIEPMLSRIRKFRDQISLATDGALDVLNKAEYGQIRKVID